jgi:hypothetical protein
MSDIGDKIDISDKKRDVTFPGWIIGAIVAVVLVGWYFGVRNPKAKVDGPVITDQEMTAARSEVDAQKIKVVEITDQLARMEQQIAGLEGAKRKALKIEYNKLSVQQNAERDKWTAMAQEYNEKVAKYKAQNE